MDSISTANTGLRGKSLHPQIARRVLSLYQSKHYDEAVLAAFKVIEERLRNITGKPDASRTQLLKETFNPATGTLQNPIAWQSEREGLYKFFDGAFLSFRNRRAHGFVDADAEETFDLIVLANRMLLTVEEGERRLQPQPTRPQPQPNTLYQSYEEGLFSFVDPAGSVQEEMMPGKVRALLDADNDGESELLFPGREGGEILKVFKEVEGTIRQIEVERTDTIPSWLLDILLADVDNDGQQEVVCSATWGAYNSALLFYKYRDGRYEILKKNPRDVSEMYRQGNAWFISAHVADIDDDRQVEVVSEPKPLGRIPPDTRYIWKWNQGEGVFKLLAEENLT